HPDLEVAARSHRIEERSEEAPGLRGDPEPPARLQHQPIKPPKPVKGAIRLDHELALVTAVELAAEVLRHRTLDRAQRPIQIEAPIREAVCGLPGFRCCVTPHLEETAGKLGARDRQQKPVARFFIDRQRRRGVGAWKTGPSPAERVSAAGEQAGCGQFAGAVAKSGGPKVETVDARDRGKPRLALVEDRLRILRRKSLPFRPYLRKRFNRHPHRRGRKDLTPVLSKRSLHCTASGAKAPTIRSRAVFIPNHAKHSTHGTAIIASAATPSARA